MDKETTEEVTTDGTEDATTDGVAGDAKTEDTGTTDWRDGIADADLRKFADSYTSPADLAKAALGLRQKLSKAVTVPGKGASEEDHAAYRKNMDIPDAPEGYEVKAPEGTEIPDADMEHLQGLFKAMHAAGAPRAAVQAAVSEYYGMVAFAQQEAEKQQATARENTEAALRKEWGEDYKGNMVLANRASDEFGGEEFNAFLKNTTADGVALGDHPTFLKTFATIGRRMSEDGSHLTDEQRSMHDDAMRDISKKISAAYDRGDSAEANRLSAQRLAMAEKAGALLTATSEGPA